MINRWPAWFRQSVPDNETRRVSRLLSQFRVQTVCQGARCPNITRCFNEGQATFMILGNICTRNCRFCAILKSNAKTLELDEEEPSRISEMVRLLGLRYVVMTSVTRDDLPDGGASQFARSIEAIRSMDKDIRIEVLLPDFQGRVLSLECVVVARPDVLAHNVEMVERLYQKVRPKARYQVSLKLLSQVKALRPEMVTKSSIMLGLGETRQEVIGAMEDLRDSDCDILTLGQYLAPSRNHYPVQEFISMEQFKEYEDMAYGLGFKSVLSGPLVRSSYRAQEAFEGCVHRLRLRSSYR
jgi:lipoic acid synthetase